VKLTIRNRAFLKILTIAALFTSTVAQAQQAQYVTVAPVDAVAVAPGKTAVVTVDCRVAPGFHVNSNKPNSELLIPTEFKFSLPTEIMIAGVTYPEGQQLTFPFMPNEPLSVYSGDFEVTASVRASQHLLPGSYRVHAQLKYQACNDRQCFAPKTVPVDFDVKVARAARHKKR
jgi:Disulphide bond corrector protein DsbC